MKNESHMRNEKIYDCDFMSCVCLFRAEQGLFLSRFERYLETVGARLRGGKTKWWTT